MKSKKIISIFLRISATFLVGIQLGIAGGNQIVVNSVSDQPEPGLTTLREAIDEANTLNGSEIIFDPNVFSTPKTITLKNGDMIINEPLTIAGPGAGLLTVDGDNLSRIFTLDDGFAGAAFTVRIQGITLTKGNGESSNNNGRGGCIYSNERLRLSSAVIKNCSASIQGGGVKINRAGNTVENSFFLNNTTAGKGGGLSHQSSVGSSIIGSTLRVPSISIIRPSTVTWVKALT